MKHSGSAVGGHSCLGFAFRQAKQQASVKFVQDQNSQEEKKKKEQGRLYDRFAYSTNNWELAAL